MKGGGGGSVSSGGSPPLILGKKKRIAEGRKASRATDTNAPSPLPLAQGLDPLLVRKGRW